MPVYPYKSIHPVIGKEVFIAPGSSVIGDVHLGDDCSVWFNVTIRGDVNYIRIGARTNIQDGSTIHVTRVTGPTFIGDDVTIGHNTTIHACRIGDRCLIGMGAIILDDVVIEEEVFIGAGALVPPGTRVPRGSLFVGMPGKVRRILSQAELEFFRDCLETN